MISNQIIFTEQKQIVAIRDWYLASSQSTGVTITPGGDGWTPASAGWSITLPTLTSTNKYLWKYEEVEYSLGGTEPGDPSQPCKNIATYSGVAITSIDNFYTTTSGLILPTGAQDERGYGIIGATYESGPRANETIWKSSISNITPLSIVNKYLWNCEQITYANGTVNQTGLSSIIGVYRDSDIVLSIYSENGIQFQDDIESIILIPWAFNGDQRIDVNNDPDCVIQWYSKDMNEVDYIPIQGLLTNNLEVNKNSVYVQQNLKCVMSYMGDVYESSVTIYQDDVKIYMASIELLNETTNVLGVNDKYMLAQVQLFLNGVEVDNAVDTFIEAEISVQDGAFEYLDDDEILEDALACFVNSNDNYNIIFAQYQGDGNWNVVNESDIYSYKYNWRSSDNSISIQSKIILINKQDVNKSMVLHCEAFKLDENGDELPGETNDNVITILAESFITITDLNDPIISVTPPINPKAGQLWLDISDEREILKVYVVNVATGQGIWVQSNYQKGKAVYTEKPLKYEEGDVWVLGDGERFISSDDTEFGAGSMLRAKYDNPGDGNDNLFNYNTWIDCTKSNITNGISVEIDNGIKLTSTGANCYTQSIVNSAPWYFDVESSTEYTLSFDRNIECAGDISVLEYDSSGTLLSPSQYLNSNSLRHEQTFTTNANTKYLNIRLGITNTGQECEFTNIKLEEGSDATEYTFYISDYWVDAMYETVTQYMNHIKESFDWDDDEGLKIRRNSPTHEGQYPFYVQITSGEMGFHSVTYNENTGKQIKDTKVVHIGRDSARILDAILTGDPDAQGNIQGSTEVNHNIDLYGEMNIYPGPYKVDSDWEPVIGDNDVSSKPIAGFKWKIEDNGSLSLIVI